MHKREIRGAEGGYVTVFHNSDWSGDAQCLWRDGDRKGEFTMPGHLMRTLIDGLDYPKHRALLNQLREIVDNEEP